MAKLTCRDARALLDSVKNEYGIFAESLERFAKTDDADVLLECEDDKKHFWEVVDSMWEKLGYTSIEKAKEILGEEHVFDFHKRVGERVPFPESQLKQFREMNGDKSRKTNLVYFEPKAFDEFIQTVYVDITKLYDALHNQGFDGDVWSSFPALKPGWRAIQTDVFPQSANGAGDGAELYNGHLHRARNEETAKGWTANSIRHASPKEVEYFLGMKFALGRKEPLFNQRAYTLLTDVQKGDGGVVTMFVRDTPTKSEVIYDLVTRDSRMGRIGFLGVIEPDHKIQPPVKM